MEEVLIAEDGVELPGLLALPEGACALVIFAHGSGSSRLSPRNQLVAESLNRKGIATLLFDLLEEREAGRRENVFDVALLAGRLLLANSWAERQDRLQPLPLGYFGASTGAAAALLAAAESDSRVGAVVSRGGRPDLAIPRLQEVRAPTLLLVGGLDHGVIELNETAATYLRRGELQIIPGATHLFEEAGTLEEVCRLAAAWFLQHLCTATPP